MNTFWKPKSPKPVSTINPGNTVNPVNTINNINLKDIVLDNLNKTINSYDSYLDVVSTCLLPKLSNWFDTDITYCPAFWGITVRVLNKWYDDEFKNEELIKKVINSFEDIGVSIEKESGWFDNDWELVILGFLDNDWTAKFGFGSGETKSAKQNIDSYFNKFKEDYSNLFGLVNTEITAALKSKFNLSEMDLHVKATPSNNWNLRYYVSWYDLAGNQPKELKDTIVDTFKKLGLPIRIDENAFYENDGEECLLTFMAPIVWNFDVIDLHSDEIGDDMYDETEEIELI